jgi:putative transcriptional regulator
MLKFKLKQVLLALGKKNPQSWLQTNCDMTQSKAHNLINNKQKSIAFKDLSKICSVLECTPDELFWWDNKSKMQVAVSHPCLTKLTEPSKDSNWTKRIEGLNPERVNLLKQFMETLESEKINESNKLYHETLKNLRNETSIKKDENLNAIDGSDNIEH